MKKKLTLFTTHRMPYSCPCAWAEELSPELVLCVSFNDNAGSEDYEFDDIWDLNP
jgi:hypothetical protein